jgi:hypothetical protein
LPSGESREGGFGFGESRGNEGERERVWGIDAFRERERRDREREDGEREF